MHISGDHSSPAQTQRNHRPTRRASDNNAEAIYWPADTSGSRHAVQCCAVRSAPRPLNNVLPPSTPGVKRRRSQRNARNKWPTTWLESVGTWLVSNQRRISDPARSAQIPITAPHADASRTHADVRRLVHPPQCKPPQCKPPHTEAGRCTTPKPHATHRNPLRRRPVPTPPKKNPAYRLR